MPTITYYVSGHGFGHARRTAPLLRALVSAAPDVRVVVRTSAPAGLFAGLPNCRVAPPAEPFDPGVVERDALTVDGGASMRRLAEVLGRRETIVAAEAAFLREVRPDLVVADIPFLAGDAAEAAGVACVAVGNFTWDWIYEPFATTADTRAMIEAVRGSYRKMRALYQMPFGHEVACFGEVVPVPMLAQRSHADRAGTVARLGIGDGDSRLRVLVAMRGGVAPEALCQAAAESKDAVFLVNQPVADAPENLRTLPTEGLDFTDVLAACDVAVSKVGYGIVSDCIANGVALLHPPRTGFREDGTSLRLAPDYMRMRGIDPEDFRAGRWGFHLEALRRQPAPTMSMRTDGTEAIAGRIVELLRSRDVGW